MMQDAASAHGTILWVLLAVSLFVNLGLFVIVGLLIRANRAIAREAMESILAGTDLNAAAWLEQTRRRAEERLAAKPQRIERKPYN